MQPSRITPELAATRRRTVFDLFLASIISGLILFPLLVLTVMCL